MKVKVSALAAAALVLGASAAKAYGCGRGQVLFADDFQGMKPSWGPSNDTAFAQQGRLVVKAAAGGQTLRLNQNSLSRDAELCVRAMLESSPDTKAVGGVAFWGVDRGNFYLLAIDGQGEFSILRNGGGSWSVVQGWQPTAGLRSGIAQWNDLEVRTSGNAAAILINGKKVTGLTGEPPSGGARVGLFAASTSAGPASWNFADLNVTAPVAAAVTGVQAPGGSPCAQGRLILADDFRSFDPSWGTPDAYDLVQDGSLSVQAGAGQLGGRFSGKYIYNDASFCVAIALSSALDPTSAGGLGFWATDANNFYLAAINGWRSFAILRRKGGAWSVAVPWQTVSAIRSEIGTWNDLAVATHGSGATFYVNGAQVAQFTGEPPPGGSFVGLLAYSTSYGPSLWQFRNFTVSSPAAAVGVTAANVPAAPSSTPTPTSVAAAATPVAQPTAASAPPAGLVPSAAAGQVLLADDFRSFNPAWGEATDYAFVEKGSFVIKPETNKGHASLNSNRLSGDIDVHVTVSQLTGGDAYTFGGLVFWAADYQNFYVAQYAGTGLFEVSRLVGGQWKVLLAPQGLSAVKAAAGALNDIEAVTHGDDAIIYVNGTRAGRITGEPPAAGSEIGLYAESVSDSRSVWHFNNLVVKAAGGP